MSMILYTNTLLQTNPSANFSAKAKSFPLQSNDTSSIIAMHYIYVFGGQTISGITSIQGSGLGTSGANWANQYSAISLHPLSAQLTNFTTTATIFKFPVTGIYNIKAHIRPSGNTSTNASGNALSAFFLKQTHLGIVYSDTSISSRLAQTDKYFGPNMLYGSGELELDYTGLFNANDAVALYCNGANTSQPASIQQNTGSRIMSTLLQTLRFDVAPNSTKTYYSSVSFVLPSVAQGRSFLGLQFFAGTNNVVTTDKTLATVVQTGTSAVLAASTPSAVIAVNYQSYNTSTSTTSNSSLNSVNMNTNLGTYSVLLTFLQSIFNVANVMLVTAASQTAQGIITCSGTVTQSANPINTPKKITVTDASIIAILGMSGTTQTITSEDAVKTTTSWNVTFPLASSIIFGSSTNSIAYTGLAVNPLISVAANTTATITTTFSTPQPLTYIRVAFNLTANCSLWGSYLTIMDGYGLTKNTITTPLLTTTLANCTAYANASTGTSLGTRYTLSTGVWTAGL